MINTIVFHASVHASRNITRLHLQLWKQIIITSIFLYQVHAKSISQARQLSKQFSDVKSILVGGKRYVPLTAVESNLINQVLTTPMPWDNDLHIATIQVSSIYMPNHGYNGTLYRINEHILSKYDTSEELIVVRILNIVSLNLQGEYKTFIKGEAYTQALTATGDSRFHEYSDNPFVEPSATVLFIPVSGIVRKVMLYPDPEHLQDPYCYIVIDYQRPVLPLCSSDVLVPHYPEVGEMVHVKGINGNELYLAAIHSVDYNAATCYAYFYERDADSTVTVRYKRLKEKEKVHFASIVRSLDGIFEGKLWFQ